MTNNSIRKFGSGFVAALAGGMVLLASLTAAGAQDKSPGAVPKGAALEVIVISQGRTQVVRTPWMAKGVAVTDPKVADVQLIGPQQVMIQGKSIGMTDITAWNDKEQVWQAQVVVETDMDKLRIDIRKMFPDCTLGVSQVGDIMVVTGSLSRADQAEQLHKFFKTANMKFTDMTSVAGVQQVLLQVRMAEVSRTAIRSLGFNAIYNQSDFAFQQSIAPDGGTPLFAVNQAQNSVTGGLFSQVIASPAVSFLGSVPDQHLQFFIQALAENQYLRILAEPNLVAKSGEEASFLAGGEFPIPIVQGGSANSTAVTIQYQKFGIQLKFRPVVLGDGKIRLYVAPEVSQLSDQGAVVLQGFRVPSLITRRAETTVELNNRQTFAMAGLISRQTTARSSRIPGAGDLPVLGALFRSTRYQNDETELLVLVTASLVEPMSTANRPPGPGVLHVTPNDWEFYALGKIEGSAPARLSPTDAQWLRDMGLNRLKGPGAWARHGQVVPPSQASASSSAPAER